MRLSAKILSKWFGAGTNSVKPPMMEALESRQLMSAVLPGGVVVVSVPPFQGPVPVVPMIQTIGKTIHAATGQRFTGLVGEVENIGATAVGASEISSPAKLQALINWGDGSFSKGTLFINAKGTVFISGEHRWEASGLYAITVTLATFPPVLDPPGPLATSPVIATSPIIATVNSTAEVVNGLSLTETAKHSFTVVVGYFNFGLNATGITPLVGASVASNVTDGFIVSPTIDWGDGVTSQGTITQVKPGFYSITGTHTYAKTGKYDVHVGVTATPAPVGGIDDPIILLVASFDSTIDVKSAT